MRQHWPEAQFVHVLDNPVLVDLCHVRFAEAKAVEPVGALGSDEVPCLRPPCVNVAEEVPEDAVLPVTHLILTGGSLLRA